MIYLHVPFCGSFCTYCDFYSEICRGGRAFNEYADAVLKEVNDRREEICMNMSAPGAVNTLYIGGGTPSVLPLDVLRRIVDALLSSRSLRRGENTVGAQSPFEEFTVEVNPEDIVEKGGEYVRGLLETGVDRVSMGIQSFDDGILRWMNRRHSAAGAVEAFRILRRCGVRNISVDLIFGLSQLADDVWEDTIERALELAPEHISAYQLSIEEGSALAKLVADGRYVEASDEQCRHQYDVLCQTLRQAGYHHYEISNFARPGFEAVHNNAYWSRVPYIGLGPGAHSLTGDIRSWNSQELPHRSTDGSPATYSRTSETLSPEDIRVERIMLSLRTDKGLEAAELYSLTDRAVINSLLSEGALEKQGGSIRIPESRLFTSDEIIRELI
ncbi:MAG: radical SAM family heme chaperone HemW [Candidatus Cryptobacteroides sp.]|nr:radical SAM family heme chaperone HemW [Alistipes sp.]MDY4726083.1 radical SAM family heme chaperone HemW [Candidatus Cryptobacteroides sp.]